MAVIGTFSSFTTARLAIYASQASLNVTGNNIANINTEGYTRQRMDLVSLYSIGAGKYKNIYNTNIGYGVISNGTTQLRDPYLDIRYRNENAKLGANSEKLDGLTQMSRILDEVGKGTGQKEGFGVIEAQFGSLFQALEDLKVNVGSPEYDDLVRTEADILTTYFNQAAKDLKDIQDIKSKQIHEYVSDINKLLTNIRDLNEQIRTQGIYGDNALELRDARNTNLDKLSEYMHINVEYSMERIDQFTEVEKLTVTLANSKDQYGNPIKLIDGIFGGQVNIRSYPIENENADPDKVREAEEKFGKYKTETDGVMTNDPEKALKKKVGEKPKVNLGADSGKIALARNLYGQYLRANGTATDNVDEAAKNGDGTPKTNPGANPEAIIEAIEKYGKYVRPDGKACEDEADAEMIDIMEPVENPDADEKAYKEVEAQYGKYMRPDGVTATEIEELADRVEDEKYLIDVAPLKDRRGRIMIDPHTDSKESELVELDDVTLFGKLQSIREMLTEEGEYASKDDIAMDPNAALKRGIPYYQKALDNLAKKLAEVFNQENQLSAETVYQLLDDKVYVGENGKLSDGSGANDAAETPFLKKTEEGAAAEYVSDDKGKLVTKERLDANKAVTEDPDATAEEKAAAEADTAACLEALRRSGSKDPLYGFYDGGVLFSNNGNNNDPSGITAANISVSASWANGSVRVLNDKRPDDYAADGKTVIEHSSRNDNIRHIISMFDTQLDYYATDVQPDAAAGLPVLSGSFREVFTSISGTLADDQQATTGKVTSYTIMTLDLENDRQSVSGVDLNEEATSMMQFSKSYSAACRLLTTIDEMLDKLINGTAL